MPAIWASVAGAAITGGFGVLGASQSQSSASAAAKAANKQARQDWRYDEKIRKKTNKYNKKQFQADVENEKNLREFNDKLAIKDYEYKKAIQDYEFANANKAHAQSEKNYQLQLKFNNIAAAQAYEAENTKLQEIRIGAAFNAQEMMIESLQAEGEVAAKGQTGRSARKGMQSAMASYGRNVAILAESMKSAERQTKVNLEKINIEKIGADLAADAARMLKPERAPSMPKPEPLPAMKFIQPLRIPRKKKPVAVSAGSSSGAYLSAIGKTLGSIASASISAMGSNKSNTQTPTVNPYQYAK